MEDSRFAIMLNTGFDSEDNRVEKEVWAYTTINFISEMGGSLGLFLGFSFLSVWDFWECILEKYKEYKH